MRDEDDAAPARLQPAEHGEEPFHLGRGKGRGRLVQNDDPRTGEEHAAELDQLLQADGERPHAKPRIDIDAEAVEMLARLPRHAPPIDESETGHGLAAEEDVLGDRQLRRDAQLLMHHADAGIPCIPGGAQVALLPLDAQAAAIGDMDAGDDLHQRALAGAVLADEAVDLALAQREVDAAERLHPTEGFGDLDKLQEGGGGLQRVGLALPKGDQIR